MSQNFGRREFLKVLLTSGIALTSTGTMIPLLEAGEKGKEVSVERIYDFLNHLDEAEIVAPEKEYVRPTSFTINGETRDAFLEHPDSLVTFKKVPIYRNARLSFGVGINDDAWDKEGDGVLFEIILTDEKSKRHTLYSQYLDPKNNSKDRKWFDEELDIKAFEGKKVSFTFKTSSGPKGNNAFDWSGWSEPQILSAGKKIKVKRGESHNIVLITVDTLRADHLHCYHHFPIKTPTFDRLAHEGVIFRNAFSQTHITSPSHMSILTSLYLKDHQVLNNSKYELNSHTKTIAEVLRKQGYVTAAAVSVGLLTPEWIKGLGKGFDQFYYSSGKDEIIAQETNRKYVFQWLEKNYSRKFFLWIHYFDPHMPYKPPPPYDTLYYSGDPRNQAVNTMDKVIFNEGFHTQEYHYLIDSLKGVRDFRYPIAQYDGEISYVDSQINELLQFLGKFGLERSTLVVVTSDHGECLGEHEIYFDHRSLYEASLHVPLIFWYPGILKPKEVESLITSVDIMPTILQIVEAECPKDIRGKSMIPLISGEKQEIHQEIYGEAMDHQQIMIRSRKWKFIKSLKDDSYHKKFSVKAGHEELYDLEKDPAEIHNVANQYPELVSQLRQKSGLWLKEGKHPLGSRKKTLDQESEEKLRSLGYVK